ncbi:MAG TPA: tetratricopeptide repeat protein [Trebonia sp.]|nr:tetratricopeptide repeat protein [Trebonia sp.]
MPDPDAATLSIEPVISWPRDAAPGQRYLLTVDLRTSQRAEAWPFADEEVAFNCLLDALPLFTAQLLDDPVLVVHKFGGTYRPVRFLLTGRDLSPADTAGGVPDAIWLTLSTAWGVPVRTVRLPVRFAPGTGGGNWAGAGDVARLPLPPAVGPGPAERDAAEPDGDGADADETGTGGPGAAEGDATRPGTIAPDSAGPAARELAATEADSTDRAATGSPVLDYLTLGALRLVVEELEDITHWRWVLLDHATGDFLTDHEVYLDSKAWQFTAFADLPGYLLSQGMAPDRWGTPEASRIVTELGAWIGGQVLGPGADILAARGPVTVRVVIPPWARDLLFLPLELAHVNGAPLAAAGITLVTEYAPDAGPAAAGRRQPTHDRVEERFRELAAALAPGAPFPAEEQLARRYDATLAQVRRALADLVIEGIAERGREPVILATTSASGGKRAGDRLRVLALFSAPDRRSQVNLHRERRALARLAGRLAASGRAADIRVLQYGLTPAVLRDALAEAEGWDVVHIAGHGWPGELLLRTPAGESSPLSLADLAGLLEPGRDRIKLVTVSASAPAALDAAEEEVLRSVPDPAEVGSGATHAPAGIATAAAGTGIAHIAFSAPASGSPGVAGGDAQASGIAAVDLAWRLDCAVLAMRYPVADEFAAAYSEVLYELLVAEGQPLARAAGTTMRRLLGAVPALVTEEPGFPASCAAMPTLIGGRAASTVLAAPRNTRSAVTGALSGKMAGFPAEPERFVGRTGLLARASAALAAGSGQAGVLLTGPPGAGKTACALELAYSHEHAFDDLVWYRAPDEGGGDTASALADFAVILERHFPGLEPLRRLADPAEFQDLPRRLNDLAEDRRILIVIDNIESLLTEIGLWRDRRWGHVLEALSMHAGLGRVILTSSRLPAAQIPAVPSGLRIEQVGILSTDEALLLARELPRLRALIHVSLPGASEKAGNRLARDVLRFSRGLPLLLELANHMAADLRGLADLLLDGGHRWGDRRDRLTSGATAQTDDSQDALHAWVPAVTRALSTAGLELFWFACCAEAADRTETVIRLNWDSLWRRLHGDGPPPAWRGLLHTLAGQGLIAAAEGGRLEVHPSVAAIGASVAGPPFQRQVDETLGTFWLDVHRANEASRDDGRVFATNVVRPGLAALPYLLRAREWGLIASIAERVLDDDSTRGTAAALLPFLEQAAASDPRLMPVLIEVLAVLAPRAAETRARAGVQDAAARGDYPAATALLGQLIDLSVRSGQLEEALKLTEERESYAQRAGLASAHQFVIEVQRLQIFEAMGQAARVFAEIERLRDRIAAGAYDDAGPVPWDALELVLDAGRRAAVATSRWPEALDLNDALLTSRRDRGAPPGDIARTRFNSSMPLLELGRIDEARELLAQCGRVFRETGDSEGLGRVTGALAQVESRSGAHDAALSLARDALRYAYRAGEVQAIAAGYYGLGGYLRPAGQPGESLDCYLLSALIAALAGQGTEAEPLRAVASTLREWGESVPRPGNVARLCSELDFPGADPLRLLSTLAADPDAADAALRELIGRAEALAADPSADL